MTGNIFHPPEKLTTAEHLYNHSTSSHFYLLDAVLENDLYTE